MDIYPCTVDENSWSQSVSMNALFGHLCSGSTFSHDRDMYALLRLRDASQSNKRDFDTMQSSQQSERTDNDCHSDGSSAPDLTGISKAPPPPSVIATPLAENPRTSMTETSSDGSFDSIDEYVPSLKGPFDAIHNGRNHVNAENSSHRDKICPPELLKESKALLVHSPEPVPSEDDEDSQVSMPSSAFESPLSNTGSAARTVRLENRKEAYKAAKGLYGWNWDASCSMVSRGTEKEGAEMELR